MLGRQSDQSSFLSQAPVWDVNLLNRVWDAELAEELRQPTDIVAMQVLPLPPASSDFFTVLEQRSRLLVSPNLGSLHRLHRHPCNEEWVPLQIMPLRCHAIISMSREAFGLHPEACTRDLSELDLARPPGQPDHASTLRMHSGRSEPHSRCMVLASASPCNRIHGAECEMASYLHVPSIKSLML